MELITLQGNLRDTHDIRSFLSKARHVSTLDRMVENVLRRNDIMLHTETLALALKDAKAQHLPPLLIDFLHHANRRRKRMMRLARRQHLLNGDTDVYTTAVN